MPIYCAVVGTPSRVGPLLIRVAYELRDGDNATFTVLDPDRGVTVTLLPDDATKTVVDPITGIASQVPMTAAERRQAVRKQITDHFDDVVRRSRGATLDATAVITALTGYRYPVN